MMWKVYIPSYKRADKIKTHKLFKKEKVVIVIGEDEKESYEKHLGLGLLVSFNIKSGWD